MLGWASQCAARPVMVWQSRHGELGSVEVRSGLVSHVRLGVVGTVTSVWGGVSLGKSWQAGQSKACSGPVWSCTAR